MKLEVACFFPSHNLLLLYLRYDSLLYYLTLLLYYYFHHLHYSLATNSSIYHTTFSSTMTKVTLPNPIIIITA